MRVRQVRYTITAEIEMMEAWEYIATHDSVAKADDFLARLQQRCQHLGGRPGTGRPYPGRPGVQFLSAFNYYIFYSVTDDSVDIRNIVHTARDLRKYFRSNP